VHNRTTHTCYLSIQKAQQSCTVCTLSKFSVGHHDLPVANAIQYCQSTESKPHGTKCSTAYTQFCDAQLERIALEKYIDVRHISQDMPQLTILVDGALRQNLPKPLHAGGVSIVRVKSMLAPRKIMKNNVGRTWRLVREWSKSSALLAIFSWMPVMLFCNAPVLFCRRQLFW